MGARDFEKEKHFEGCMPVEALAERGPRTLTFGPLKPVGFVDPRTGRRPWAILQLRAETLNGETCNLVGCQTKLTYGEQARVFRMVPGLEKAEFARFGSMHRNTYVNAPVALNADLSLRARPRCSWPGRSPAWKAIWNPPPAACGWACCWPRAPGAGAGPAAAGMRAGRPAQPPAHPGEALPALQRPFRPHAGAGREGQKEGPQGPLLGPGARGASPAGARNRGC